MKIKDFAKEISTPVSTVMTWKRRGDIPSTCFKTIGGTIFVKINEIMEWLYRKEEA